MQLTNSLLEIDLGEDTYNIEGQRQPFHRGVTDEELENLTDGVLESFHILEQEVKRVKSVTLSKDLCRQQLVKLAGWGMNAYKRLFKDPRARQVMAGRMRMMGNALPEPTFRSERVLFPWEVLYEGNDYLDGDPEMFWGLRYAPARILDPEKDVSEYPWEQAFPQDMLFCLHHLLRYSHELEQPEIERLIVYSQLKGYFSLLGPGCGFTALDSSRPIGEIFIKYLDLAKHNMVHFACHCKEGVHGDTLLFSLMEGGKEIEVKAHIIELETYAFDRIQGRFQRQPLVFLNACQSVGGADDLRRTFNLPKMFIERGAAAVVATACPVPDLFAASFARVFYEFFLRGYIVIDQETGATIDQETGAKTSTSVRIGDDAPMRIGGALRATRKYFLEYRHNPLGLAYGLYSPAHYQLAQIPGVGGGFY